MIGPEQSMGMSKKITKDIPKALGIRVITTTFLDANLLHDNVTGKSVTALLHFLNTTQLTDIQKDKPLWKEPPMAQNL